MDLTVFLFYMFFLSDFLSKILLIQFVIGFIPFSVYFIINTTSFYIKIISYPFKVIKGLMVLLPLVHLYFNQFWCSIFFLTFSTSMYIYLHLFINSFIFICFPYNSYLFLKKSKNDFLFKMNLLFLKLRNL